MSKKPIIAEMMPRGDDIDVLFPDEEPEEMTAAEKAAQAAIEQLSSNAEKGKTIRIYRQIGSGKESMEYIAKYPADKFSIDDLIDKMKYEYGGGDYRFMIYNEKGKLAANKLICIGRKVKPESADSNNGVYGVLERMMDKQDEFMRRMMAGNSQNGSRTEMLQEMLVMKELFAPANSGGASPTSQIKETLELMAMLKDEANPEKEESGGFAKIISEAMPLLNTMATAATQPRQATNQHRPNPQRRQRKQTKEAPDMKRIAINQLLTMKQEGKTPEQVAEELSSQIPDSAIPQIESLILGDDPVSKIIEINKRVGEHREWFEQTIEWLKGYLGHPCKYDSEFDDSDSQTDENLTNTTDEPIIQTNGETNKPNDGNT